MKEILLGLLELDLVETELEDGTKIENLRLQPGNFPMACRGWIEAKINGQKVKFPHLLPCQKCGGCE